MTNHYVWTFAASGNNLFAGTDRGVFLSTDNGTSWRAVNNGLTDSGVYSLAISGNTLFAGTIHNSVCRMDISSIPIITNPVPADKKNSLFINTLHGAMIISYAIASSCVTQLKIYALSGKLVAPVVNGIQASGKHTVSISKDALSAGMYVVSFKAGNYNESKRVLVSQ